MFDLYNKSKLTILDLILYVVGSVLLYIAFFIAAVLI